MTITPLISFCMSTYRRPQQLRKQLQGMLQQEYENFEIIVSDNDPEASAKDVALSFADPRIKYFSNEMNLGMVRSFNMSFCRSIGEYIVMITDDDPIYPDMLRILVELLNNHPGYGVYAGCADWIVETELSAASLKTGVGAQSTLLKTISEGQVVLTEANELPLVYLDGLFTKTFLLWSCCIIERKIVEDVNGMPDYGSELLTDHAYIIATGSRKGLAYINKALGGQSVRGDNFGYDFDKVKEKYLNTPTFFFNYIEDMLKDKNNWHIILPKLRTFIGRAWVEYSLMIYWSLRKRNEKTSTFFEYFHKVFSSNKMKKWKYKFYLKRYFPYLFKFFFKMKAA